MRATRTRPALLAVGAMVIAACTAPTASSPSPQPQPPESVRPTVTPAGTPGPDATQTASPAQTGAAVTEWSGLVFNRPETPAWLNAVVDFDGTLVGVGAANFTAAVWTLPPGGEWTRQEDVPAPATDDEAIILTDVVVGPNGLVATGIVGVRQSEAYATTIFTSPDGVAWAQAQRLDGVIVRSVAVGDAGLVAVGGPAGFGAPRPPAVWRSADGTSWSAVDVSPLGNGHMAAAVWHAGRFIAGGGASVEAGSVPAAWTSPDGRAWTETWRGTPTGGSLAALAVAGDRLVAVGGGTADTFEALISTDAVTWSSAPLATGALVRGLAASPDGLLAVGQVGTGPDYRAAAWTSTDATSWTLVETLTEDRGSLADAVILSDRTVAVGGTAGDTDAEAHPLVVTGPPPGG